MTKKKAGTEVLAQAGLEKTEQIELPEDWLPEGWLMVEGMAEDPNVIDPNGITMPLSSFMAARESVSAPVVYEESEPVSWMDGNPDQLRRAIVLRTENRSILLAWIKGALVETVDYGRIHFVKKDKCPAGSSCTDPFHYSKPSLWKAGAEKIAGMLGLTAVWPELRDELGHLKAGAEVIGLRCQLIDQSGRVVSEGVGARSTKQDYNDINKSLKMAKKSGLIDAVLNAGGLSEVFTQDIVDDDNLGDNVLAQLDEEGQHNLLRKANEMFGDQAEDVLSSLARNRFRISSGNWREIPARRYVDAVRSLEEKAEEGLAENVADFVEGEDE
jgi:hypothetical protein